MLLHLSLTVRTWIMMKHKPFYSDFCQLKQTSLFCIFMRSPPEFYRPGISLRLSLKGKDLPVSLVSCMEDLIETVSQALSSLKAAQTEDLDHRPPHHLLHHQQQPLPPCQFTMVGHVCCLVSQ